MKPFNLKMMVVSYAVAAIVLLAVGGLFSCRDRTQHSTIDMQKVRGQMRQLKAQNDFNQDLMDRKR